MTDNSPALTFHDPSDSWVASVIRWSVQNQLIVLILAVALTVSGSIAVINMPLDAVPDLTDTQP